MLIKSLMGTGERHACGRHGRLAARVTVAALLVAALAGAAAGARPGAAQGAEEPWAPATFMLQPRSESAVAELDGRMYVIGGYPTGRIPSDAVQVWDAATDHWELGPPLPMPLHHVMAASVNGTLYAIGGEFDGAGTGRPSLFVDTVFALDPAVGDWEPRAPMPTGRSAGAAVALNDKIYVVGGRPPAGYELEMYDPATDAWTVLPDMPTARNHLAAGAIDGKLYVVGGRFGGGFDSELTNVTEVYDPETNTWAPGPPAPTIRSGMAFAVVGHCLYVFGGERNRADPRGVFPQTEALDPRSDTWYELTPMSTPMHGQIGAAVFDGRIHIAGGAVTYGGDSGTVLHQVYTPEVACD
ncbi:MAG TPA: kelch repeat-containing protein [Chloroflexota bacterium]|nr:kelch repeat-containing protein [Chloroflexota bacterium]